MVTFVDGYFILYLDNNEMKPIALQDKKYKNFYCVDNFEKSLGKIDTLRDDNNKIIGLLLPNCKLDLNRVFAWGRFEKNSRDVDNAYNASNINNKDKRQLYETTEDLIVSELCPCPIYRSKDDFILSLGLEGLSIENYFN